MKALLFWLWPWPRMIANFWRRIRCVAEACLKREGLAFLAFLASFGCGVVMTAMLAWAMAMLRGAAQWEAIANLAYGLLATLFVVLLSLHRLLGSRQAIELEFWKLKAKFNQGEDGDA